MDSMLLLLGLAYGLYCHPNTGRGTSFFRVKPGMSLRGKSCLDSTLVGLHVAQRIQSSSDLA